MKNRMRLRYRLLLLGTLIVLAFQLRANAVQPTLEMNIDRFITHQMTTQHIPGLALAITHENQVMYVKGYGKANTQQPVTPQTQFPIASLSKSFTAVAVLQLVEVGQIDLDAPVKQYLPDFTLADTKTADQIAIRHLLNHTSGLSDFGFSEAFLPQPTTHAERVESLHNALPVAAPGTQFHYFNPNYDVLARVVEVVSGQSFGEYLRSRIFTPLQMSQTFHATSMAEALQRGERMATEHLMAFAIPLDFSQWKRKTHATSKWQILLGIAWMFFPLVVVLSMSWLVAIMSDRIAQMPWYPGKQFAGLVRLPGLAATQNAELS